MNAVCVTDRGCWLAKAVLLASIVSTAGCSGMPQSSEPGMKVAKNTIRGTRVFFANQCVRTPDAQYKEEVKTTGGGEAAFLVQLAATLIPSVLNKVADFASNRLEKVGKEYSASATAGTSVTLNSEAIRGCIMFVSGSFADKSIDASSDGWSSSDLDRLGLLRRPDVYAEFVLHDVDGDGKYVAITPVFFDYQAALAKRTSGAGTKDLSFIVEIGSPGTSMVSKEQSGVAPPPAKPAKGGASASKPAASPKPDDSTSDRAETSSGSALASYAVSFGTIAVGSTFQIRSLKGMRSQSQLLEKKNKFVNVAVTAVETEDGGDVFLKLASFLEENKKPIVDKTQEKFLQLLGADSTSGQSGKK
jgi:hypothetical protein